MIADMLLELELKVVFGFNILLYIYSLIKITFNPYLGSLIEVNKNLIENPSLIRDKVNFLIYTTIDYSQNIHKYNLVIH